MPKSWMDGLTKDQIAQEIAMRTLERDGKIGRGTARALAEIEAGIPQAVKDAVEEFEECQRGGKDIDSRIIETLNFHAKVMEIKALLETCLEEMQGDLRAVRADPYTAAQELLKCGDVDAKLKEMFRLEVQDYREALGQEMLTGEILSPDATPTPLAQLRSAVIHLK